MIPFWLSIAALTLAAVAVVLRPLLRARPADAAVSDDDARRLAVYRDRRREIEADRDAGRIDAAEADRAIDELAADAASTGALAGAGATAANAATAAHGTAAAAPRRLALAAAVSVAIPVIAAAVYLQLGAPMLVGVDPQTMRGGDSEVTPEMLDRAIAELEQKTRSAPTAETWVMLAQARRMKGDGPGAVAAYGEASALEPRNARLLADWAETIAIVANGDFSGRPVELLERALAIEATNPKAMAMMGIAQYRLGNPRKGLEYLRALQATAPAGSEQAQRIGEVIARIESELAQGGSASATQQPPAAAPPTAAPAASASDRSAGTISGTLSISEALRRGLPGDATVFVVARAPEGPRVPYAVLRMRVSDLPAPFTLSDAQSMDPSRRLSAAGSVVIEARVSRSGTAQRQAGDPIGSVGPVVPGATGVGLTIDRTVDQP